MAGTNRRGLFIGLLTFALITLLFLTHIRSPTSSSSSSLLSPLHRPAQNGAPSLTTQEPDLHGHAIAPKLGNETLKAELGRAAWKLFHTTFAQFPDRPTAEESAALRTYIHLFQRLYPCGECAGHFGKVLRKYPPQVSSRSAAAAWGCHVHNVVNKRLGKAEFDCAKIGDFYDCGCKETEEEKRERLAGGKGGEGKGKMELERMGETKGG